MTALIFAIALRERKRSPQLKTHKQTRSIKIKKKVLFVLQQRSIIPHPHERLIMHAQCTRFDISLTMVNQSDTTSANLLFGIVFAIKTRGANCKIKVSMAIDQSFGGTYPRQLFLQLAEELLVPEFRLLGCVQGDLQLGYSCFESCLKQIK